MVTIHLHPAPRLRINGALPPPRTASDDFLGCDKTINPWGTAPQACGVKVAGAYGWQPHHPQAWTVWKSGSLNLLETSGPVQGLLYLINISELLVGNRTVGTKLEFFPSLNSPPSGQGPRHSRGFCITYNDAPQSVGLLWARDQPVAETSTLQHITDRRQCP